MCSIALVQLHGRGFGGFYCIECLCLSVVGAERNLILRREFYGVNEGAKWQYQD